MTNRNNLFRALLLAVCLIAFLITPHLKAADPQCGNCGGLYPGYEFEFVDMCSQCDFWDWSCQNQYCWPFGSNPCWPCGDYCAT